MKTIIILITAAFFLLGSDVYSQDVNQRLSEASSSYQAGDLENARFALQEALNGINQAIGREILEMLPAELGSMSKIDSEDNVTGTNLGFAGLYVNRHYQGENRNASFEIVSDSPMLAGISSLLNMSVFMASDPNQKRIKVDGYKALMTRSESMEGEIAYDVQMPFGKSLLTFRCAGIADEKEVTGLLDTFPVSEIVAIAE